MRIATSFFIAAAVVSLTASARGDDPWIIIDGGDGPGKGKHIVLVSGDEEYRSEEALPQLAKILAKHHGFKCTVLFAINPTDGSIDPNKNDNIPGLEALKTADLMILFTRFRNLPDEQMKMVVDYVESGKPVMGMRTATHAFNLKSPTYGKTWPKGFGREVLGENWVNHHGTHGRESTRGIITLGEEKHPILRGIKNGDIWGPTDVYTVNLPMAIDVRPLVMGQVLEGMKFDDKPLQDKKNAPMMPVAWTKTYKGKSGKEARIFTTTMGAATDLVAEGTRRMLVNGAYWALGMEDKIPEKSTVDIVGEFKPTPFGFGKAKKGLKPADYK